MTPEPSAFIAYIFPPGSPTFASLLDVNAMRRPSGDQYGNLLLETSPVKRVTPEPSAFITYIAVVQSLLDENAMRRPSGDQDGE